MTPFAMDASVTARCLLLDEMLITAAAEEAVNREWVSTRKRLRALWRSP